MTLTVLPAYINGNTVQVSPPDCGPGYINARIRAATEWRRVPGHAPLRRRTVYICIEGQWYYASEYNTACNLRFRPCKDPSTKRRLAISTGGKSLYVGRVLNSLIVYS